VQPLGARKIQGWQRRTDRLVALVDPALAKRSMELLATEVMPRVNKAIGTSS